MSDEFEEVPGWTHVQRHDGYVVLRQGQSWVISPPQVTSRPVVRLCPCCQTPFRTAQAAKRGCNVIYPMRVA